MSSIHNLIDTFTLSQHLHGSLAAIWAPGGDEVAPPESCVLETLTMNANLLSSQIKKSIFRHLKKLRGT